ncbi:alpha/beta hydrolase [Candidatus Woesearchaeota archaeon]|nr:alpha/beta hydrolase [Candidatus Woesearchaeota archaeon]
MILQRKTAIVNGCKMRYLQGGTGKTLIFLHGWPTTPHLYEASLKALAQHYTVYAPYLFDGKCGNTLCIAKCVRELTEKLGLKNVIVVGTSFGGAIAGILAREKLVSRLVLVNPAGVPRSASFAKMLVNLLRSSGFMLLHGDLRHVANRFGASLTFFASLRRPEKRSLFREISASAKTHGCHIFGNIPAKTTLIWCKDDFMFPVSHAPTLNGLIKGSNLITVEGDHYWPFHHPRKFAESVISALE